MSQRSYTHSLPFRPSFLIFRTLLLGMVIALLVSSDARAVRLNFTIDPSQSSLTHDLYYNALEVAGGPQGPGADITSYSGMISVEVDDRNAPTSIQFLEAAAAAANNGSWLPEIGGGSEGNATDFGDADPGVAEPANYGMVIDIGAVGIVYGAFRETVWTMSSGVLPVAGGSFNTTHTFTASQGLLDSNISSPIFGDSAGTDDITGDTTDNNPTLEGSYVVSSGVTTLSIPLDLVFNDPNDPDALLFYFAGTITGKLVTGDMDCDLDVDFDDIDDFVTGLNNPLAYEAMFGMPPSIKGDTDGDGDQDFDDISGFVAILSGGEAAGSGQQAVPEPSSVCLVSVACFMGIFVLRRSGLSRLTTTQRRLPTKRVLCT